MADGTRRHFVSFRGGRGGLRVFVFSYRLLALELFAIPLFWFLVWLHFWRRRHRPGYCSACGYNLLGNTSGTCPECGKPVNERAATNDVKGAPSR